MVKRGGLKQLGLILYTRAGLKEVLRSKSLGPDLRLETQPQRLKNSEAVRRYEMRQIQEGKASGVLGSFLFFYLEYGVHLKGRSGS